MNRFVLDCSVAMGWVFEDEADAYGDAVFQSFREAEALVARSGGWKSPMRSWSR